MKEEWLFPNAIIPVNVETTQALVVEIKRLIDVVGGMALECPNCEYHRKRAQLWRDEAYKQAGHPLPEREQEPVAFINVEQRKLEWAKYMSWDTPTVVNLPKIPLYTAPPQRTWIELTDDERQRIRTAVLKEKNT